MMRMFHAMETLINPTVALARWDARGRVRNRFDGFPRCSKAVETARFSTRHPVHRAKATVLMRRDVSDDSVKITRQRTKATVLMRRDDSGVNIKG